jgi:hypothetical protein
VIASLNDKTRPFGCTKVWSDEFLSLFPHRWDFLYAQHPNPEERPDWNTESRYALSDRQIQQGEYLYGVRFGSQTSYLLIDVDPTSWYYPEHDPFAIASITAALEPIGLVSYIPVRSSYRNGIHLYFPFENTQPSWAIALVVQTLLESAGFSIKAGQLEIFPNARACVGGTLPLYNGHRLPLQAGSYILNEDWMPIYSTQAAFVAAWKFAKSRNVLDPPTIERVRKQAQRQRLRASGKAQKFLNDLNTEIEPGWTGPGQTNQLLGKIACRERVFHHILHGGEPLTGETLAEAIVQTACSLPGFSEFCQHQDELELRAREYARAAEKRYYPFGSKGASSKPVESGVTSELTWNQQQALAARERIRVAIANMLNQSTLPFGITDRIKALRQHGISGKTLYKHKDLWHPKYSEPLKDKEFSPVDSKLALMQSSESLEDKEFSPVKSNKFVGLAGLDAPQEQSEASPTFTVGGYGGFSTGVESMPLVLVDACLSGIEYCRLVVGWLKRQQAERRQQKLLQAKSPAVDETYFQLTSASHSEVEQPSNLSVGADYSCFDVGDLIAEIQVHVRRINWTSSQVNQFVASRFVGKTRERLTDDELVALLNLLRSL